MSVLNISDFSGGLNRHSPEKLDLSEASELSNLIHIEGNLQTFAGRTEQDSGDISTSLSDVNAITRFVTNGVAYTIASKSTYLYLDTATATQPWRPIINTSGYTKNTFAAMEDRLYVGTAYGESGGKIYRWDSFIYYTGTASCAGGTGVTGTGTSWVTGAVRKGDKIFFYYDGSWSSAYHIITITNATSITLNGLGPNTGGAVPYIISRYHECGVPAPTDAITAAATAGTAGTFLEIGTYQYKYTYKNTYTGVEGNPNGTAISVTTTSANAKVRLTSIAQNATTLQIDQINLYRTRVGGSQFYYATAISRDQTAYTFPTAITDSKPDASLGAILELTGREMPPQGMRVFQWNNRLCGYSSSKDYSGPYTWATANGRNRLVFSTLNEPEYWPTFTLNPSSILEYDADAGGYITIGEAGVDIMSVVLEGIGSDKAGQSLLVFKQSGMAYRLRGYDWSDFEIEPAFQADCVSDNAVNINGRIFWVSKRGPMMLEPGAFQPVPIFEKIFPTITSPFTDAVASGGYGLIRTCGWREYFVFAYPDVDASNDRVYAYHIPTGTWTQIGDSSTPLQAASFAVFNGPDDDGGLYAGAALSVGKIWKLFAKTSSDTYWSGATGVRFAYKTPLLVDLDPEANNVKKIGDVHVCFHRPSSTQTIKLSLYKNGLATAAESVSKSLSATASSSRIWVNWKPQSHAASFQLGITGTVTRPVVIERLKIPSDIFGREQNRQGR